MLKIKSVLLKYITMSSMFGKIIVVLLSIWKGAVTNTIFDVSDNLGRNSINDNIIEILENLRCRTHMDMTKDLGVPRLDPFFVKNLVLLQDYVPLDDVYLSMTNITIIGLKNFVIKEVDFDIFGLEFLFDITVPTLTLSADYYEADGWIGKLFSFQGKGPFRATLQNVTFNCDGRLRYLNDIWSISDLSIYLAIDDFKGSFDGLTDRFVNEMLNESGPELFKKMWPFIEPSVASAVAEVAIDTLSKTSLLELIELLSGNIINWPPVNDSN